MLLNEANKTWRISALITCSPSGPSPASPGVPLVALSWASWVVGHPAFSVSKAQNVLSLPPRGSRLPGKLLLHLQSLVYKALR